MYEKLSMRSPTLSKIAFWVQSVAMDGFSNGKSQRLQKVRLALNSPNLLKTLYFHCFTHQKCCEWREGVGERWMEWVTSSCLSHSLPDCLFHQYSHSSTQAGPKEGGLPLTRTIGITRNPFRSKKLCRNEVEPNFCNIAWRTSAVQLDLLQFSKYFRFVVSGKFRCWSFIMGEKPYRLVGEKSKGLNGFSASPDSFEQIPVSLLDQWLRVFSPSSKKRPNTCSHNEQAKISNLLHVGKSSDSKRTRSDVAISGLRIIITVLRRKSWHFLRWEVLYFFTILLPNWQSVSRRKQKSELFDQGLGIVIKKIGWLISLGKRCCTGKCNRIKLMGQIYRNFFKISGVTSPPLIFPKGDGVNFFFNY